VGVLARDCTPEVVDILVEEGLRGRGIRHNGGVHGSDVRRWLLLALSVVVLVPTAGMALAVVNSDEPALQTAATWARDHGFSKMVDRLEMWRYDGEPSTELADDLTLADGLVTTTSIPSTPTTSGAPVSAAPTTTTTTYAPTPLVTAQEVPLDGEGRWIPVAAVEGRNVMWATSTRPLREYGSVRATFVRIDQSELRFGLYNGTQTPGGRDWVNGHKVAEEDLPGLMVAFNGGFRFEHLDGGYFTEGREVKPLVDGQGTIAIDRDGRITIGMYGRDLTNDGTWVSIRQNLPLMIDDNVSIVDLYRDDEWGVAKGGEVVVFRSALCSLDDGMLMYVAAGDVGIGDFARILVDVGCRKAVQLDVNGTWPQIAVYYGFGTADRSGIVLDSRMRNANRYINGTEKDFFAGFVR